MSTTAIVLIAIGVVALLAILFFALSRSRSEEKRLRAAREQAASRHREVASQRHSHASVVEQRAEEARLKAERAQQEAELARREAQLHEGRAELHEQGELDHELATEHDHDGDGHEDYPKAGPNEDTMKIRRPEDGRFSANGTGVQPTPTERR
jgi:FtsZ-interacting cell division protein ZipA